MRKSVEKSVEILKKGGIILYPTDTVWGIGCDATNYDAVSRIFQVKQRSESKSLIILVNSEAMLKHYVAEIPTQILEFLQRVESPTTVIYKKPKNLASNVIAQDNSVAIRIVKDDFCQRLIAEFGKPIVSTSANISGESTPAHFGQIDPRIVNQMDFVVKYRQDDRQIASSSRLIRFSSEGKVEILR